MAPPLDPIDVLANVANPDRSWLVVSSFTQPAHGTVSKNPDGTLRLVWNMHLPVYRPRPGGIEGDLSEAPSA